MVLSDRFDAITTPPAVSGPTLLTTPAGSQTWDVAFTTPGEPTAELVSEPFAVSAGESFVIRWETGVQNHGGISDLDARLSFDALSDGGISLSPCEGPIVELTPVQPTTWGSIKARFR